MAVIVEPKVSSRATKWIVAAIAALDVFFMWTYLLWANADTWAINRAEEDGADPSLLLPHPHLMFVAINLCAVALLLVNILLIRAWASKRRTSRLSS